MSKKKIAEIVGAVVFSLLILASLGWFFLGLRSQKLSIVTSAESLGLAQIPLDELKAAETSSIIAVKNLRVFGNVPVVVSGGERSKYNPFRVEDPSSPIAPLYLTDRFSLAYPTDWFKKLTKEGDIQFYSPLENRLSHASVKVHYQDLSAPAKGHEEIKTAVQSYASLSGISPTNLGEYVAEISEQVNSSFGGKVAYSYKLGDVTKKGWIFALSFKTPNQEQVDALYKLILDNQKDSKYLTNVANELGVSANGDARDETVYQSIVKLLKEKTLTAELNYLNQDVVYNIAPYQGILILNYETDSTHFDQYQEAAQNITKQISFTETVTLPNTAQTETITLPTENPAENNQPIPADLLPPTE